MLAGEPPSSQKQLPGEQPESCNPVNEIAPPHEASAFQRTLFRLQDALLIENNDCTRAF